ncbi:hypothetical protein GTP55_24895 [Duganella sp. FT109W]|uniref:Uncharacterized protein n=1 Tax=Duganella margarita TaxID=2692170 RepID=A0ABW9WN40_9BURK|nr:hypothetical protein [Duganella margarita]MYN42583.1 hypothetical protein [Duganella margarita]
MKRITLHPARVDREAYAIDRMSLAAQRLLAASTMADEIRAGQWVLAWAVAAGARPSARLTAALSPMVSLSLH